MWKDPEELAKAFKELPWSDELEAEGDFWPRLAQWIQEHVLLEFLTELANQVDEIVEIDPNLTQTQILEVAAQHMVEFLEARSASVRIFDPLTEQLLHSGSFPSDGEQREISIPLEGTVAGEVLRRNQTYLVPDLQKEDRYHNKELIERLGVGSMMAVPLEIPRFFPRERDTVGVIQIYYPQKDRAFSSLEILIAKLMARRLSFAIARQKLLSMYRFNEKREAILRRIYHRLGRREGIKMKDVFNRVIPELADIINIQSCALFSVTDDRQHVIIEAGYPEMAGYHSIGKQFAVTDEQTYFMVLNLEDYLGESAYDVVTPNYILVADPRRSRLISDSLKAFAAEHKINSILYMPLDVGGEVTHFMTFDALDQRVRYSDEEIEIFLFLGRELVKAQRMERLDDILHDFKNPAIATAGFARRLKRLLEQENRPSQDKEVMRCVDVLLEETTRLQELALSVYEVGKEQVVNLTERLQRRFDINEQAIKELLKQNVDLRRGPFQDPLWVKCYPLHLERVIDNLLNNATNAIPAKGGMLRIASYIDDGGWACAEIANTGRISEEDRLRLLEGEGSGRGLLITHRIIRLLNGRVDVRVDRSTTTFVVRLPLYEASKDE